MRWKTSPQSPKKSISTAFLPGSINPLSKWTPNLNSVRKLNYVFYIKQQNFFSFFYHRIFHPLKLYTFVLFYLFHTFLQFSRNKTFIDFIFLLNKSWNNIIWQQEKNSEEMKTAETISSFEYLLLKIFPFWGCLKKFWICENSFFVIYDTWKTNFFWKICVEHIWQRKGLWNFEYDKGLKYNINFNKIKKSSTVRMEIIRNEMSKCVMVKLFWCFFGIENLWKLSWIEKGFWFWHF